MNRSNAARRAAGVCERAVPVLAVVSGSANEPRRIAMVRALSITLLTALYLRVVAGEIPVYEESTFAMLLARDGLEFGRFEGNNTSFGNFRTGTLIIRYFAGIFALGLGMVALQLIVALVWGLSMAIFDYGVRRRFGDDVGWAPAAILLAAVTVAGAFPFADTGYVAAPVIVASTLTLLHVTATGSSLAAAICGACQALTAETHPSVLLGLPVFLLTTRMSCKQPRRALSLGVASAVATALVVSFHTSIENVRAVIMMPWIVPAIVGTVACALLIGAWGRPFWLALDVKRRLDLLLAVMVVMNVTEIAVASAVAGRALLRPHYMLFSLPALAILAGLGLRRWRARGGLGRFAAAIPAVLLAFNLVVGLGWRLGVATGTAYAPTYTMREAQIIARHFWKQGYSFPDVQRHLRGPQGLELIGAIAVFAPSADAAPERPMPDLRVIAFSEANRPDGPIPAGGTELDLGRGHRAWILPLDGWVRLAPSRACFEPAPGSAIEAGCVDIESDSIAYTGRYRDLFRRVFPAFEAAQRTYGGLVPGGSTHSWELPIEITGNDRERHVDIVGLIGIAPWRIVRVEGVQYRGDLPGRHVVLERGERRSGRLVLAAAPSGMALKDYPPDFLETRPEEAALRRTLRRLPPFGPRMCEVAGTCPAPIMD